MPHFGQNPNQNCISAEISIDRTVQSHPDDLNIGLSDSQIEAMREQFGRNELSPPQKTPWWKDLIANFQDPTIRILFGCGVNLNGGYRH